MKKISVFLLTFMLLFSTLPSVSATTETVSEDSSTVIAETLPKEASLIEVTTPSGATTLINAAPASYPTAWVPIIQYDVATSNVFVKATKTAFAAAVGGFLTGTCSNAYSVAATAAVAFGTYYFVESDTERVYYFHTYQWREIGPPSYDYNGNVIPQYEIQKTQRTTKNSNATGGQVTVTSQYGSILTPWF